MRLGRFVLVAAALLPMLGATLGAQQVQGVVRDSVSGFAVPGAVVTVLDANGAVSARTLTDQAGRFAVAVPAGPARLRVIRIGFRPRDVRLPATPADRARSIEVRMASLPALLTGVRVSGRSICPGSEDRTGALALWDQARAGLLATVVVRQTKPGDMNLLEFVTDEDPDSRLVLRQTLQHVVGSTGRPFVAVNQAAGFAEHGYMERDAANKLTFFAPDADVLLDPAFARTHCFRAMQDSVKHPDEVGLGFEPAPGQRPDGFVDVAGTLWMTSSHPALRTLDFTFTGLDPAYRRAGIGGTLHFRSMPNGLVYIDRWSMLLPAISAKAPPRSPFPGATPPGWPPDNALRDVRVTQISLTGGVVVSASWPDGTHAETPLGTVTGVVRDRGGHSLAGVYVYLDGTPMEARTDSTGRFTMAPVLPGRYGLDVVDSLYAPFIDPRKASRRIRVERDTLLVDGLELKPRAAAVGSLCGEGSASATRTATVLGTIIGPPAPVGRGVKVEAAATLVRPGNPVPWHSGSQSVTPSDDGRFIICHMLPGATLTLRLVRRDSVVADTSLTIQAAAAQRVDWPVRPWR